MAEKSDVTKEKERERRRTTEARAGKVDIVAVAGAEKPASRVPSSESNNVLVIYNDGQINSDNGAHGPLELNQARYKQWPLLSSPCFWHIVMHLY